MSKTPEDRMVLINENLKEIKESLNKIEGLKEIKESLARIEELLKIIVKQKEK